MPDIKRGENLENHTHDIAAEIASLTKAINALRKDLNAQQISHQHQPLLAQSLLENNAFVYEASTHSLMPIAEVSAPPLALLIGIDHAKETLLENTRRFANGFSANNALLWGARGMGKSTLIKSIHKELIINNNITSALIEIHREDITALPKLLRDIARSERRCILFCDDMSFNNPDQDFKALKSILEGGLEGRPDNILFYATSNRRHLLPRNMVDQEAATGIRPNESMDETIALSDRFGLWLGFHSCSQPDYLAMVYGYLNAFGLVADKNWQPDALEWAKTRGHRSGRTAWQFVQHIAGHMEQNIHF